MKNLRKKKYVSTKWLEYQIAAFACAVKINHSFSTLKNWLAVKKIYVIHHFCYTTLTVFQFSSSVLKFQTRLIVLKMFFRMEKYASIISYAWYMMYFQIFPKGTMHLSYFLLFTSSLWDIINQQSTILRWFVAILHPHMHTPNAAFKIFTTSFSKHMYEYPKHKTLCCNMTKIEHQWDIDSLFASYHFAFVFHSNSNDSFLNEAMFRIK